MDGERIEQRGSKEESGRKGKMRKKERKMRVVLGKFGNI